MLLSYQLFGFTSIGFDPDRTFVRSDIVSTYTLASIRALIAIYIFSTIIVAYAWLADNYAVQSLRDVNIHSYFAVMGEKAIGQTFSYFTFLTFWALGFYFAMSAFHTFCYARWGTTMLHRWPRPLQLAHSLFYSTIVSFPWLVTMAYWGTLWGRWWPTQRYVQWLNLTVHALNSVFALVEMIFPATNPPPLVHLSVVLLILSVYLGLAYLTHATANWYVYEWLNPAHGKVSIVLHVFSYAAVQIGSFFAVYAFMWLRKRWTVKAITRSEKYYSKSDSEWSMVKSVVVLTPSDR